MGLISYSVTLANIYTPNLQAIALTDVYERVQKSLCSEVAASVFES